MTSHPPSPDFVAELFGGIDIYLFDQLQKGRFGPEMRILDAGCGNGRNISFLLRSGYNVFGVDRDPTAIEVVQHMSRELAPQTPSDNFRVADLTALPYADEWFDIVICNAVLHFAADEKAFEEMCVELMRVIGRGGFLFARLASDIGIEDRVTSLGGRRFRLPDGTERFLVTEVMLLDLTQRLGGALAEPIKTVNVQGRRCMTTWCVNKNP